MDELSQEHLDELTRLTDELEREVDALGVEITASLICALTRRRITDEVRSLVGKWQAEGKRPIRGL